MDDNIDKSSMNSPHTAGSAGRRFNRDMAERPQKLETGGVTMVRKFILTLATAAAVGGTAFIPATASAGDIGRDVREIRRDRADLRHDEQQLRHDAWNLRPGAMVRDLRDIHRDRQDLREDRQDLQRDINRH
jgi:hypothetical protein